MQIFNRAKKYLILITILIAVFAISYVSCAAQTIELPDPLHGQADNIPLLVGSIINYVLGILGVLALVMFICGGLIWMTSEGAPDKIKKGKDTLIWAILGLALIFFSYALLDFILGALQQPSS